MEEQLKEIEGLLETTAETTPSSPQSRIKKYIKLVFPHVALVAVVCLYAVIGAYIFYRLESPNEDRLKAVGKNNIGDMRMRMLDLVKRRDQSKRVWKDSIEEELYRFNDKIYKAFKEQYVRYPDVRVSHLRIDSVDKEDPDRMKRHRNTKSRADKGEKMWTASSALFFAATTMATIGYGNIVPATSSGRIACVVFALFGAPLAIITIGDLGKFLSECTIWLYKQMKKAKIVIRTRWKRLRGSSKEDCEDQSDRTSNSTLDWEELVMDKTEVPVLMVFTILLLYIAFGGVLFSFLEGWTYMDAFYYSFISLTTIGFGDIVPENHDYIVLMLMYLGVGLAVTTMCIDLVGIQYIQKIHYFGRKFRGTDLLHLLKRKRMIERRLAMGQGEEILQMYMQQMQQQMPDPPMVEETFEEKCPTPEWAVDDAVLTSRCSFAYPHSEKVPSPNVLSIRSFRTPSIYSNSSASARSMMFRRYCSRGASWDESGPSLSEHCSLSTEPSVYARQAYWENFRSPEPSLSSFEFEFPLPSPDYAGIAAEARRSRRILSCPAAHFTCPPPSPIGLACMEDWDSYIQMLEEYEKPYERFVEDESCMFAVIMDDKETMVRRGKLQRFMTIDSSSRDESEDSTIDFPVEVNACPVKLCKSAFDSDEESREILYHYGNSLEPIPVFSVDEKPLDGPSTLTNTIRCPVKYISKIPPSMVVDNFCFICDGDEVSEDEILSDQQWWKQTSSSTRFYSSENLTTFHQVTLLTCRGEMRGAYRSRARGAGITSVALNQVFRVSRYFSSWRTCTSFHRIVSVISPITEDGESMNKFKKRIFVQYFWRQERPHDREMVTREYMEFKMKTSPRHSLVPPSTLLNNRSWSSRSHYPGINPYTSALSTSSLVSNTSQTSRAHSRWNILGKAIKFSRPRVRSAVGVSLTSPSSSSQNNNNKRFSVDDNIHQST